MRLYLFALLTVCSLSVSAQKENKFLRAWNALQARLDSSTARKYDPAYIEVPDKPWRVVLRSKSQGYDMSVESEMDESYFIGKGFEVDGGGSLYWSTRLQPPITTSIGFFAGYRGLGFSYAKRVGKKNGNYYSFGTTGARYGLNVRLRDSNTEDVFVNFVAKDGDEPIFELHSPAQVYAPIRLTTISLDGYYLLNGRRFSQAAAYNQSVIQRRSSGSLMLGGFCYMSVIDYADPKNAFLIQMNGDAGQLAFMQVNVGAGYGYNWVPWRGWLFNAMVMPTISIYDKVKFYYYDCNYSIWANIADINHKPFTEDNSWLNDVEIWETDVKSYSGKLRLNVLARASVTYTWNRYFVNIFGQFNHYGYHYDITNVNILDWYARASFGVRF